MKYYDVEILVFMSQKKTTLGHMWTLINELIELTLH